jgi:type II secretory pathway predicted ATPase ExeA
MYNAYFGFRENPFNITPDPRFFYPTPIYQEAAAGLLYGIHERKGFLVLTGEVGTGKTTLLHKVIGALEENIRCAFLYNTSLNFDELLHWVCDDFGLTIPQPSRRLSYIQALNTFLLGQLTQGGTAVLFIDEAQNLDDGVLENLRLLSNLETTHEKLLQIVLVGQPELGQKLRQPTLRQLKQRVAIQCQLDLLKEREIEPFIQHRLRIAGYEGADIFLAKAVERIWAYSYGTPRLINVLCDNALLLAYSLSQKQVFPQMIEEVAQNLQLWPDEVTEPREAGQGALFVNPVAENRPRQAPQSPAGIFSSPDHPDFMNQQIAEDKRETATNKAEPKTLWPGLMSGVTEPRPRKFLQAAVGIVCVLLLLGGAGAAISPSHTTERLSQFGLEAKAILENLGDQVTSVPHGLLRWFTTPSTEDTHQEQAQTPVPPLALTTPEPDLQEQTDIHQADPPTLPTEAVQLSSSQVSLEQVNPEETAPPKPADDQRVALAIRPQDQPAAQPRKQTEEKRIEKEEQPEQEPSLGKSSAPQKQEEARGLLQQMGYVASGSVLRESAENGHTALVALLLTAGIPPDEKDAKGWTSLMYAAWNGHTATVQELLKRGASANEQNTTGVTALTVAAMNGHTAIVQDLRKKGADVNREDAKGWTPLMYAAWNGHTATVQSLIANGASINAKSKEGWTALMYAVWKGHLTTIQALLDRRAELHIQSHDGETALRMAANQGDARIVEVLKKAGAQE